ncbi:MAG TPA: phage tail protein [Candidatus Dormibacteraeota bacterium]|nr:phage tail protein [Candidatus Dormibacteraeota bacterium]
MAAAPPPPVDTNLPVLRPFTAFNFVVLIDLSKVETVQNVACNAAFSECDGLEMTLEPKTIREGGRNTGPVHLAGAISYGQLTLKRGMTQGFDLWKWFDKVAGPGGGGFRTTATIVMRASDLSDEVVFKLRGCLPVKLKAPALNAKDGLVAIEEMQIAYENLEWQAPTP